MSAILRKKTMLMLGLVAVLGYLGVAVWVAPPQLVAAGQATSTKATTQRITNSTKTAGQLVNDGSLQVLLILDASGSMGDALLDGQTKMNAAKIAINKLVKQLAPSVRLGLRVYGGGLTVKSPCADTRLQVPIQVNPAEKIKVVLETLTPAGPTPISQSLVDAVNGDFPLPNAKKHIILISDGAETCSTSPCPIVLDLLRKHPELKLDVIGFGQLDNTTTKQLNCVAAATFGRLVKANSAKDLEQQLTSIIQAKKEVKGRIIRTVEQLPVKNNRPAPAEIKGF
jgi:Ca-activated chloride channel family protein